MSTYDRVSEQILKEKKRVDEIIKQNEETRKKCIESLQLCELQIHLMLKVAG